MKDDWSQVEEPSWESVMEAAAPAQVRREKAKKAESIKLSRKMMTGRMSPEERERFIADSIRQDAERARKAQADSTQAARIEAAKIENLPLVEAAERRGLQYEKEGRRPGLMESMLPRVAEAQRRGGYGLLDIARAAGSDILSFPGAAFTSLPTSPLGALRVAFNALQDYQQGDDRSPIRQVAESVGRSIRNTPAYMMQRDNIIADPANVIGFGVGKALSAAAKMPEAASTLGKIMRAEGLLATAGRGAIRGGLTGGASGFMRSDATGVGAALDAIPEAGAGVLGDALMSALGYGFRVHAAKKVADAYKTAPGFNKAIRQERLSSAGLRERHPVTEEMLADLQTKVARARGKDGGHVPGNYADWDATIEAEKERLRDVYRKATKATREEIDRGMYSLDPYFGEGGLAERAARDIVGIPAIADKYRTPAIEAAILDGAENPAGAVERQVLRNIVAKEVKPYLSGLSEPELSNFAIGRIDFGRKGNYSHLGTSESPLDQALSEALSADIVSPSALRRASEMQPEHYKILASQIRGTAKRQGLDAIALNEEIGDRIRKTLSSHLEERSPAWAATITPQVREDLAKASALREFVANTQSQGDATRRNIGGPVGMLMDLKAYRQDRSGGDNFQRAVEALRKAWKHQERTAPMLEAVLPYLGRSAGAYAVDEVQR